MSHSKHDVDIDHQFHRYDGAGHGLQDFQTPTAGDRTRQQYVLQAVRPFRCAAEVLNVPPCQ